MIASESDLWIFRDGKRTVSGRKLLQELQDSLEILCHSPKDSSALITSLIQAGELEAALADHGFSTAPYFAALTDAIAGVAFSGDLSPLAQIIPSIEEQRVPDNLDVSPAEGFAYYALDPLEFGKLVSATVPPCGVLAVIGIRSIGTTLSAVVAAALRNAGNRVDRSTVRPTGHPYDRRTRFSEEQLDWIAKQRSLGASFFVVDEGPGRSGSTFLSVGDALVSAGVARQNITFTGSRQPQTDQLCAPNAAVRWNAFKFRVATSPIHARFMNHVYAGGGEWRRLLLSDPASWPPCWPQTERLKFISPDANRLFKFEGLGPMGNSVRLRAKRVHEAGFGPEAQEFEDGFTCYALLKGPPLQLRDLSLSVLERIAHYCTFRSKEFRVADRSPENLAQMVRFNAQLEFGVDLELDPELLHVRHAIIADGRMQPFEWIHGGDGAILKVDAATHGDDHFFPGPTDIAWDVAGAAIEWNLDSSAVEVLVRRIQQLTGDDLRRRLPAFTLAYTISRMAAWKMAISTVAGSAEESGVRNAFTYFHNLAKAQISKFRGTTNTAPLPSTEVVAA